MADLFWPADIHPSAVEWKLIDSTAVFTSPLTGATRTVSRGGLRWQCSLAFESLSTTQRARSRARTGPSPMMVSAYAFCAAIQARVSGASCCSSHR